MPSDVDYLIMSIARGGNENKEAAINTLKLWANHGDQESIDALEAYGISSIPGFNWKDITK